MNENLTFNPETKKPTEEEEEEEALLLLKNAKYEPYQAFEAADLILGRHIDPYQESQLNECLVDSNQSPVEKLMLLLSLRELEAEEKSKNQSGENLFNFRDDYAKEIADKHNLQENTSSKQMIETVLHLLKDGERTPESSIEAAALILGRHIDPYQESQLNECLVDSNQSPVEKLTLLLNLRKKEQDKRRR